MRVTIELTGTSPLLMKNVQLSDPMNKWSKAIAVLTDKGEKMTDEDIAEKARLQFMGSLYIGAKGPAIPAANIRKCINEAAKIRKLGKDVLRALLPTLPEYPLIYDGPRTPDELWANDLFRDQRPAKIGRGRVIITRPRFINWGIRGDFELMTDILNFEDFQFVFRQAGIIEGLGDGRNIGFGRFESKAIALVEQARKAA